MDTNPQTSSHVSPIREYMQGLLRIDVDGVLLFYLSCYTDALNKHVNFLLFYIKVKQQALIACIFITTITGSSSSIQIRIFQLTYFTFHAGIPEHSDSLAQSHCPTHLPCVMLRHVYNNRMF